jgi:lipoyl(octanoyl) transferase
LERVAIAALADHGVEGGTIEGLTGIWTKGDAPGTGRAPGGEARKIGSIGVHVSRGVTTHGLAVNVNNDLQPFEWIVPCGIEGCRVTSLGRELGAEQDLAAFGRSLVARFSEEFERSPVATDPAALGLDSARLGIA